MTRTINNKRLFGFAALTSAFSAAFDLSQRNTQSALTHPSVTYTASAEVGREMSQTGAMISRRKLNVQPTIKVPVGYKFTVRVNRDTCSLLRISPWSRIHFRFNLPDSFIAGAAFPRPATTRIVERQGQECEGAEKCDSFFD